MRPKDQKQTQKLIARWNKLLKALVSAKDLHTRPLSTTQRKSMCVISGRILNVVVCTFEFSDTLLNTITQSLDSKLMRMQTHDEIVEVHGMEINVFDNMIGEIKNHIKELERMLDRD
jgi:hypothetical protein